MPTDFVLTSESGGESLVSQMLRAPLIGLDAAENRLVHAVDMDGLAKMVNDPGMTAVCGASVRGLIPLGDQSEYAAPWPPRVAGMAPMVRCQLCYQRCTVKRPRTEMGKRVPDDSAVSHGRDTGSASER